MSGIGEKDSTQELQLDPQISDYNYVTEFVQLAQKVTAPKQSQKKQKFSPEEDEMLKVLVGQHGNDWKLISEHFSNRNPRQCRDRWKNYVSPMVTKVPFTPEEDNLLIQKFNEYGRQWSVISKFFSGRTDIHVKNRWTTLSSKFAMASPVNDIASSESISQVIPPPQPM